MSVFNNSGIPIELHPEYKIYIPELLFSNFQADISKARNVLDWHPIFTVEEGMQNTAVDFLRRS